MSNHYAANTDSLMTDEALIALFKMGQEESAFAQVVRRYEVIVKKTTFGMCGKDDGDDVAQEVFLRFFRKVDQFEGQSSLGTYLTRIAINLSLNHLKKRISGLKKWAAFSKERVDQKPVQKLPDMALKELLEIAMNQLDEESRSVVVLRLVDGYSVDETAKIMRMPRGTIASKLNRAQKKLQQTLKELKAI